MYTSKTQKRLILASGSTYRRELLARLRIPFEVATHASSESTDPALPPRQQVEALAVQKAESLRGVFPDALIIGSDQGLVAGRRLLGKPGTAEAARAQLAELAGGTWDLVTAVTVLDSATGVHRSATEVHRMTFRHLSDAAIERYVDLDLPLDCAGSFRIESLGIALFSKIEGEDPTAIMGLPLLKLTDLLESFGMSPLEPQMNADGE